MIPSAFVYCKSWETNEDEELTVDSSVSAPSDFGSPGKDRLDEPNMPLDSLTYISKTHFP
jgi:hypothetical protein